MTTAGCPIIIVVIINETQALHFIITKYKIKHDKLQNKKIKKNESTEEERSYTGNCAAILVRSYKLMILAQIVVENDKKQFYQI